MARKEILTVEELGALFEGSEIPVCLLLALHSAVHLRATYQLFPQDLVSAFIFDEVVAHAAGLMDPADWDLNDPLCAAPGALATRATNVHSLAASTGIPRETVRRKVKRLVAQGWLEQSEDGALTLQPMSPERLAALAGYAPVLRSFLRTARALESLLARKAGRRRGPSVTRADGATSSGA